MVNRRKQVQISAEAVWFFGFFFSLKLFGKARTYFTLRTATLSEILIKKLSSLTSHEGEKNG